MAVAVDTIHIPILRFGEVYESLDINEACDLASSEPRVRVSLANSGLIRRDYQTRLTAAWDALQQFSTDQLIAISRQAGDLFMNGQLPAGLGGEKQSPDDYIQCLSSTSGLPHNMCRKNMAKIHYVMTHMDQVLAGLTRNLPTDILDQRMGEYQGTPISFYPCAKALGVVLPSNSPGVHSIWLPAIPLKMPLLLKPGSDEPWTPWRIVQAFIQAGVPAEAFGFYPTTHEGSNEIMQLCDRSIIFGDTKTVERYAGHHRVQAHGPGWSKIILGEDVVDDWPNYISVLAESMLANGGRSCINASCVVTPRHADEIAEALAKVVARIEPASPDDPKARLSAFAKPAFASAMNQAIETGLTLTTDNGVSAHDITRIWRHQDQTDRIVCHDNRTYMRPTVVRTSLTHPLGNTEYMFPYMSVVEVPQDQVLKEIGYTLVCTAITRDQKFANALLTSPDIGRLNLGPIPTTQVEWNQPHEGNLFEFLFERRAIQQGNW